MHQIKFLRSQLFTQLTTAIMPIITRITPQPAGTHLMLTENYNKTGAKELGGILRGNTGFIRLSQYQFTTRQLSSELGVCPMTSVSNMTITSAHAQ